MESEKADSKYENFKNPIHTFTVSCGPKEEYTISGRPCDLSAFCYVPPTRRMEPASRSIYNSKGSNERNEEISDYDRLFKINYSFNNKVHRCDRKHAKLLGLDVWKEEINKEVGTRSSTVYGKEVLNIQNLEPLKVKYEIKLDPPDRKYTRIATVQSEFYNRNEINDLNQS